MTTKRCHSTKEYQDTENAFKSHIVIIEASYIAKYIII